MGRHKRQQKCNFSCSLPVSKGDFSSLHAISEASWKLHGVHPVIACLQKHTARPQTFTSQHKAFIKVGFKTQGWQGKVLSITWHSRPAAVLLHAVDDLGP